MQTLDHSTRSVGIDRLFHSATSPSTRLCLAAMRATASLPRARRCGGLAAHARQNGAGHVEAYGQQVGMFAQTGNHIVGFTGGGDHRRADFQGLRGNAGTKTTGSTRNEPSTHSNSPVWNPHRAGFLFESGSLYGAFTPVIIPIKSHDLLNFWAPQLIRSAGTDSQTMIGRIRDLPGSTTPALYLIAATGLNTAALTLWGLPQRLRAKDVPAGE